MSKENEHESSSGPRHVSYKLRCGSLPRINLVSQPLLESAVETSGLDDFGRDTFKKGLDALISSLNNDLDLPEGAAGYLRQIITQILINRLQVTRLLKDHLKIQSEEIEAPIFIMGLLRTGTTITHTLMALDPLSRSLRNFVSAGAVCPPPSLIPVSLTQGFREITMTWKGCSHCNLKCGALTALISWRMAPRNVKISWPRNLFMLVGVPDQTCLVKAIGWENAT